jgi:hypothetical protein
MQPARTFPAARRDFSSIMAMPAIPLFDPGRIVAPQSAQPI